MRHTANRDTFLGYVCDRVAALKPGECLTIGGHDLRSEVPSFFHNDAEFTAPDRVLGNIIGSAYTHSYTVDMRGDVTLRRHEDTGQRRYADPDRRGERKANEP